MPFAIVTHIECFAGIRSMKLVQQSKSRLLSFLLFSLCLSGSVHMAAGSDSSTAMGSSIRSVEDAVYLNVQRTDYYIAPSQLKLECDSASGGDVSFWREQNGLTEEITVAGSNPSSEREITFSITPEMEGSYYCMGDGVRSEPRSVEIVAYPLQNHTVKSIKTLRTRLHGDITLPCVFTPGALSHRYSIQWYMGLIPLDAENNTRYMVSPEDFSLTIMDANALDASDAYYCVVDVVNLLPRFNSYHRIGPSISLVVTDSLSIFTRPSPSTHLPSSSSSSSSSSASFSCTAYGLPPPSITWLHKGSIVKATNSQDKTYSPPSSTTMDKRGATVTRELFVTELGEDDSGLVECLVLQDDDEEDGLVIMSSSASLSVLPSSFTPHLLPTSTGVELSLTLPTLIPSSFSLAILYYDNSGTLVGKSLLVSPSFANTHSVDYVITPDQLPPVTEFSARVTVIVGEVEGDLSEMSNLITVQELSSSSVSSSASNCNCDNATGDESTTQTVLIFFVVLLILLLSVAVCVAIWGVVMMIKKLRRAGSKDSISERSYSPSRSSYRSRSRSGGSSRSRSRSPGSRRHSKSPSFRHSHKSESGSCLHSTGDLGPLDYKSGGVADGKQQGGVAGGREDPEGSIATDEYLKLTSAPPVDVRSRTGSAASCQTNNVASRPLPSAPYEQHSHQKKAQDENEYEELQLKIPGKKRRRRVELNKEEGEGEKVGNGEGKGEEEREEMKEEGEGMEEERKGPRFEEEGEWLVVRGIYSNKAELEETTESVM